MDFSTSGGNYETGAYDLYGAQYDRMGESAAHYDVGALISGSPDVGDYDVTRMYEPPIVALGDPVPLGAEYSQTLGQAPPDKATETVITGIGGSESDVDGLVETRLTPDVLDTPMYKEGVFAVSRWTVSVEPPPSASAEVTRLAQGTPEQSTVDAFAIGCRHITKENARDVAEAIKALRCRVVALELGGYPS